MARASLPEKLNVCLVTSKFPAWGRASEHGFLWVIARGLVQTGHSVTVLSSEVSTGQTEVEQHGVKIYYVNQGKQGRRSEVFADRVKNKFVELHTQKPFHTLRLERLVLTAIAIK
jgi:1,2-diacylglycerol 3-alpha-glucosyltransferase